jgi:hypothetical protein
MPGNAGLKERRSSWKGTSKYGITRFSEYPAEGRVSTAPSQAGVPACGVSANLFCVN